MKTKKNFYTPLYWPFWILIFFFWCIAHLPYRFQMTLGKGLGLLLHRFAKRMKRIAQINLDLCFPELSIDERAQLLRKNFISVGKGIFETALAWWGSDEQLQRFATFHGEEYLNQSLAEGKGVIFLGGHFTSLELVGRLYAMRKPFAIVYREHKIPFVNFIMTRHYKKIYAELIERNNIRAALKRLKRGEIVWFTPDVDAGHFHNVFVPFFNVLASSVIATSRLAALTKAKVCPVYFFRQENDEGYEIKLQPPLTDFPTDDVEQDTARINKITEKAVRQYPDQYMWQYMRFKTRPEGEERFYRK